MAVLRRRHAVVGFVLSMLVVFSLAAARPSRASDFDLPAPIRLDPQRDRIDPSPGVWLLEDPSGRLSYDEVTGPAADRFAPLAGQRLNFGYTSAAYWIRLEVDLPESGHGGWLFVLDYPLLDEVTYYARVGRGPPRIVHSGDHRPLPSSDLALSTPAFRLPDRPGERVELHVRVRSAGTVNVPLMLWRSDALLSSAAREDLSWGLYHGWLLALALYNLFLWTAVRDRMYLFYVGYLFGLSGFTAAMSGHAFQYLWPRMPALASFSPGLFLPLCAGMGVFFVRQTVDVASTSPRLYRPMWFLGMAPFVAMPIAWLDYSVGIQLMTAFAVLIILFLPIPVWLSWRRGYRPARYILFGLVLLVPAWILLGLRQSGVQVDDWLALHGVQFATAAEALVLSFALADRINLLRSANDEAQARRLDAEQAALTAQRDLSRGLIEAQDAERRRIAAELHDGLGQNMLVLCNALSRLAHDGGPAQDAVPLVGMAKQTVGELRAVAHALHPHKLDRLGLAEALESTVEQALDAAGIDGTVRIDAELARTLPSTAQLHIYRIVQEAVANSVKHAGAGEVSVSLDRNGERLALRIRDDGAGMPVDVASGLGLASIEERARLLGGVARMVSPPGEGLRVEVDVPLDGARLAEPV